MTLKELKARLVELRVRLANQNLLVMGAVSLLEERKDGHANMLREKRVLTGQIRRLEKLEEDGAYPRLMMNESNGLVVLFSERHCGTVVKPPRDSNSPPVGYMSTVWNMGSFAEHQGSIEIDPAFI